MTGKEMRKVSNILVYGLTDEQLVFVYDNLPNSNISVTDCSGCFTDIIATAYIAYLSVRDDFIKSGESEQPKELKDTQKAFIGSAIAAAIYTIIKLA